MKKELSYNILKNDIKYENYKITGKLRKVKLEVEAKKFWFVQFIILMTNNSYLGLQLRIRSKIVFRIG